MTDISNYLEAAIINLTLRNTAFTELSTVYIALGTADFTDAGTDTEPSGGNYARATVTAWDAPSDGVTQNTNVIAFATATADWGTITHAAIYDAATVGNQLYQGDLTAQKIVQIGDSFQFNAGALSVTIA